VPVGVYKHKPLTEQTKNKISESRKGKISGMKGKHQTEEARQKISRARKGGHLSEGAKEKLRNIHKGIKLSEEHKLKLSKSHKGIPTWNQGGVPNYKLRGSNHYNWKGGITSLADKVRRNYKYRQWRSDVYTRDEFTCQECGIRGIYLHAHHIKPFSIIIMGNKITTTDEAFECEELWNINNGITLCIDCHKNYHESKGEY
jgi:hypothetical protein